MRAQPRCLIVGTGLACLLVESFTRQAKSLKQRSRFHRHLTPTNRRCQLASRAEEVAALFAFVASDEAQSSPMLSTPSTAASG